MNYEEGESEFLTDTEGVRYKKVKVEKFFWMTDKADHGEMAVLEWMC